MSYSISMPIDTRQFRPRWGLTLAATAVALLCVALGIWQLQRADQKIALAHLIDERLHQPPVALERVDFSHPAALRYLRVELRGQFDTAHEFYIPHRLHQGAQGLHVITPLRLADSGRTVLVNRGWIAGSAAPAAFPAPPDGEATFSGRLVNPATPPLRLGPANSETPPWHRPWVFADPVLYAERSGAQTLPMVLLLDATVRGGFERGWELPHPDPSMHYGYAIQWFAFAFIALVVWALLSRRQQRQSHDG